MTSENMSRSRKLLFSAISLLLFYLLAEGAWAIWAPIRYRRFLAQQANTWFEIDETMKVRLRPGSWESMNLQSETCRFHINRFGLRGREIVAEKSPGTLRILCLGGSTTFGSGCLADSLSYPAQLERALAARFPESKIEVLNAGVMGYVSVDSYHNLGRLAFLEPDLVLVFHGINDVTNAERLGDYYYDPDNLARPAGRAVRYRRDAESTMLESLARRLFGVKRVRIDDARSSIDPRTVQGFRDNLLRIVRRGRKIGARVALLTFEARIAESSPEDIRQAWEADSDAFLFHKLPFETLVAELARFNQAIRDLGTEQDIPVIEVEGKVPKGDEYWSDVVHMSGEGAAAMVDQIVEPVSALLPLR